MADGPVIAEVPEETGQGNTAKEKEKEPSPQADLDTSLVESIEKLLRWSQAQPCRADTFAVYTAALWPAVSTADSTAGRLPSRIWVLVKVRERRLTPYAMFLRYSRDRLH